MFKTKSLRFKVSLLYVLVLGVILIVYSVILHYLLGRVLYRDIDNNLRIESQELSERLNAFKPPVAWGPALWTKKFEARIHHRTEDEGQYYDSVLQEEILKASKEKGLENDYVALFNERRELIAASENVASDILSLLQFYSQLSLLAKEQISNFKHNEEPFRLIVDPIRLADGNTYILQIATSTKGDLKMARRLSRILLWPLPFVLILGFFAGRWLTVRILKPVTAVAKAAEEITQDDLGLRVPEESTDEEMQYLVQRFNRMIARLEQSFNHISEFSSYVAHELKAPLSVIRGESEIALRKERSSPEYQDALSANLKAAERMIRVIEDMLLLSRLGYDPKSLNLQKINFNQFIQEIYEQSEILAEAKHIEVSMNSIKDGLMIAADEIHLRRLFLNIIDNAIKFTPNAGKISILVTPHKKTVKVSISDTGQGISEADLPKIFDKFYRGSKDKTSSGHGLGLSIAYSIAKAHDGEIGVKSQLGQGTTFTVILPTL